MARVGPTVVDRRRLEQPIVGVMHRASRRERAQVGGTLLPPTLSDALCHPAQQHGADDGRGHRGDEKEQRLTRVQTALDPTRDTSRRPRLHAATVP
jgi:hypothetical protein